MGLNTDVEGFAGLIADIIKSDYYCLLGLAGIMGIGKSTLLIQLQQAVSKKLGLPWSFKDNCTWSRKEFKYWVDGVGLQGKKEKGIPYKQKPEFSSVLCDELFSMFYRRNWNSEQQQAGITTLNTCRDRHLFIGGNVPNFWDLDGGFLSTVLYYVYVVDRGRAWIFEKEKNPFSSDPWNVQENKKAFRKLKGRPYKLPNFVSEITFPDLSPAEKKKYLAIRNKKRMIMQTDVLKEKTESYSLIKQDRDNLIRALHLKHNVSQKTITEYCSLKKSAVSNICLGIS